MARKTTNGNGGTSRPRKTTTSAAAAIQAVPDLRKNLVPINLEDEIRRRAYEIYVERGSTPGSESEDWFAAEREIVARYKQEQTA